MTPPSRLRRAAVLLALAVFVVACLLGGAARLAAQGVAPVKQHVALPESFREVAARGRAPSDAHAEVARDVLSAAETAEPLQIELTLRMRHFKELERRVAAGETISREEMAARFLPDEKNHRAVADWLRSQGLTVAEADASHMLVAAMGTPAQLQAAFQTRFARVRVRGEEYTAAVAAPSLPAEVETHVSSIHGLQPYLHPRKRAVRRETNMLQADGTPPFLVRDILTAYNIAPTGLTGAGQKIAIVIDSVPLSTDLTRFWNACGVNQSLDNIITVNVRNRTLPAATGEETLDVAWSSGLASAAQIVIYACGDLNYVNQAYSRILSDLQNNAQPGLHQVTMSYGAGEQTGETSADINAAHQLYTAIAAYGVSLFASSGDDGAYGNGGATVQALYPASDPMVTGVGGTSLYLNGNSTVNDETAWSRQGSDDSSSGGGVSKVFARPDYQTGPQVPDGTGRLVPDVSLVGDPDTGCYLIFKGRAEQDGGTSLSTPCWAAMCAMLNQARANQGLAALSTLNSAIYPLQGTSSFRDITSGNNGVYYAGAGYDAVTGLGVPNFAALVAALATPPPPPAPVITSETSQETVAGEPYTYFITASNAPTSFGASGLPAGVSFDPASGLITGAPPDPGTYTIALSATNAGGTGRAALLLTVLPPPDPGPPTVTLKAVTTQAIYEAEQIGAYRVRLSRPAPPGGLIVHYTILGNAVNGTDYNPLKRYVKVPEGKIGTLILIFPTGSLPGYVQRHVYLRLDERPTYTIGTPYAKKVTISTR